MEAVRRGLLERVGLDAAPWVLEGQYSADFAAQQQQQQQQQQGGDYDYYYQQRPQQQQMPAQADYGAGPARRAQPRAQPQSGMPRSQPQQQQQPPQQQQRQQQAAGAARVQLWDMSSPPRGPPETRRDADGGYGQPSASPAPARVYGAEAGGGGGGGSGRDFTDWLEPLTEQRQPEPVQSSRAAGEARGAAAPAGGPQGREVADGWGA